MRVPDPDRRNLLEGKVALLTGGGRGVGTRWCSATAGSTSS